MRGPCASCGVEVVLADAIVTAKPGAQVQPMPVEPKALRPAEGLLLYVGISAQTGRWVVTPLGTPSADTVRRMLPRPHAHRLHVCDTIPALWPLEVFLDQPVRVPVQVPA